MSPDSFVTYLPDRSAHRWRHQDGQRWIPGRRCEV